MTVAPQILHHLDTTALLNTTGWHLADRGACRGDVCVPVDETTRRDPVALARAINVGLAHDHEHGVWAIGPQARGRTLSEPRLPDVTLAARDGAKVSLRSLIGRRGMLVAWASW